MIQNLHKFGYSAKDIACAINQNFDIDIEVQDNFIQKLIDLHKDRDLDNLPDCDNYWHNLNIDQAEFKIDVKDYLLSDPYRTGEHSSFDIKKGGVWTLSSDTIFSQKWLEHVENTYSIIPGHVQIFYKKAGVQHNVAHVDMSSTGTAHGGAINWIVDPDDSEMIWYRYPDMKPTGGINNNINDQSIEWPTEKLTEIERAHIGQTPTLVRTDVPHSIKMGKIDRWAVSFRILTALSWHAHVTVLEQYFQK